MALRLSFLVGLIGAACFLLAATSTHPPHSDWDQIYYGAQTLLSGGNPYAEVRHDQYPSAYPLTALILILPLAWLPFVGAQALWVGVGTGVFSYAMIRRGWWGLLALGSAPFANALLLGQWSPLLVGAVAVPWLTVAWAAKPTIGAALWCAYPSRRAVILSAGLIGLSLLIRPDWPADWFHAVRGAPHQAPIMRPGGVLLLLGLLRWRDPRGRLLAGLSLVPQMSIAYELVPLLLIPRSARQMATLVVLSQVAFAVAVSLPGLDPAEHLAEAVTHQWPVWLVGCYLPALLMVLRHTPQPIGEVSPSSRPVIAAN